MECSQQTEGREPGILYLSATPIGNLEDMTYRSVRILSEVSLIAAEDTRHTRKLLSHYDIHTKLTSYHEHNKEEKGLELIRHLLDGEDLVCVSDAGLPGIADPGSHLVGLAIEAGIRVVPLPGANAALSALIASGLDTVNFTFVGFLPKTEKKRGEILADIRQHRETLIFYEAPHRLPKILQEIEGCLGGKRRAVAARELTKCFEEFRRGTLAELSEWYGAHEPRGEFVLLVEGFSGEMETEDSSEVPRDPVELYRHYLSTGINRKEAMREAAKQLGISRRAVYQLLVENGFDE